MLGILQNKIVAFRWLDIEYRLRQTYSRCPISYGVLATVFMDYTDGKREFQIVGYQDLLDRLAKTAVDVTRMSEANRYECVVAITALYFGRIRRIASTAISPMLAQHLGTEDSLPPVVCSSGSVVWHVCFYTPPRTIFRFEWFPQNADCNIFTMCG